MDVRDGIVEDMDVLPRSRIKCILGCEYQGPLVCSTSLRGPNMTIVDAECPNQACIRVFFLENELGMRNKSKADVIESGQRSRYTVWACNDKRPKCRSLRESMHPNDWLERQTVAQQSQKK